MMFAWMCTRESEYGANHEFIPAEGALVSTHSFVKVVF